MPKFHAPLLGALILLLGAAPAAPSRLWAATAPALTVRAGVGGVARPGRWLPVEVDVRAADTAFHGSIAVAWGTVVAHHDLDLAPSSTTHISLLVRTISASPGIRVSLIDTNGLATTTVDTPLSLVPFDQPATLCIGEVVKLTGCTARIAENEAPTTARALDFADDVIWSGSVTATNRDVARAVALARAVLWWRDSGSVDPIVAPFDTTSRLGNRTSAGLAVFIGALLLFTGIAAWRRASAMILLGTPIMLTVGGLAFVAQSSREVDIQAASFVHQFSGVTQSIVLMHGEVEHPGGYALELTPDLSDASVDVVRSAEAMDSATSAEGRGLYRHTAGRGVRQRFELSGVLDAEWLRVTEASGGLTIENRSPQTLGACEVRSKATVPFGDIAAGGTARIPLRGPLAAGDAIVCGLPPKWLSWSAPNATVRSRGSAFLVFHVPPDVSAQAVSNASR